jgi:hypothetical protein
MLSEQMFFSAETIEEAYDAPVMSQTYYRIARDEGMVKIFLETV